MKKELQIALKFMKWILLGIFCPILLYIVISLIFTFIPTSPEKIDCKTNNEIHFSSSAIHVDIVLPITSIDSSLIKNLTIPVGTKYIAFGWGDQAFYLETKTWADLSVKTALKSLITKTPSAMHVTYLRHFSAKWKTKNICSEQLETINSHILSGFEINKNGSYVFIENGYGKNDFFYEGKGEYTGFKTCNTWMNECMKKSKIKTATWTPFSFGILRYIKD